MDGIDALVAFRRFAGIYTKYRYRFATCIGSLLMCKLICKYKKFSTTLIHFDFHFEFVITILKNFLITVIEFQDFEIK